MDTDEQVCFVLVDNIRPILQWQEDIGSAGIDKIDLGEVVLDELPCEQSDIEVEVLLVGDFSHCSCVFPAVPCVNHHGERLIRLVRFRFVLRAREHGREPKTQAGKREYIRKRMALHRGIAQNTLQRYEKKMTYTRLEMIFVNKSMTVSYSFVSRKYLDQ